MLVLNRFFIFTVHTNFNSSLNNKFPVGNYHEFGVELHQFNCQHFMNNKDYSRASKLVKLAAALLDCSLIRDHTDAGNFSVSEFFVNLTPIKGIQ